VAYKEAIGIGLFKVGQGWSKCIDKESVMKKALQFGLLCAALFGMRNSFAASKLKRMQVAEVESSDRVIGVETYYGLIVAARRIDQEKSKISQKNPPAGELLKHELLVFKNGLVLERNQLEFLYVEEGERTVHLESSEGKHPYTDDGTGGSEKAERK